MMLSMKNGQLYQSDPNRSDGLGSVGYLPPRVVESTVMLQSPQMYARENAMNQARERKALLKLEGVKAKKRGIKKAKELADNIARARNTANQVPVIDPSQELIKKELLRQKNSNADFYQYERMADSADFGRRTMGATRADFRQTSTTPPTGNPLTRDGRHGPVTDFDRYVKSMPFSSTNIPSGLTRQNNGMSGMGDLWSDLVDKGQAELDRYIDAVQSDPAKALADATRLAQQVGVIQAPAPVQQAPIPRFLPPAVQQAMTGTVTLPFTDMKIQKAYLIYGGMAAILLGGTAWFLKRRS